MAVEEKLKFHLNSKVHAVQVIDRSDGTSISSGSAESLLLLAILEKLEEIRCGLIDLENIAEAKVKEISDQYPPGAIIYKHWR